LFLLIIMAILEAAGVASVMPFLAVLGDPKLIETNNTLKNLYEFSAKIGVSDVDTFLFFLGLGAFALIVISAAYKIYTHYSTSTFIEMLRHSLGARLFENYLRQPYAFFLDRNSGDMSKNILSELDAIIGGVIRPAFNMVASIFVLISITTLLLIVNPWLAFLAAGTLCMMYLVIFTLIKRKVSLLGDKKTLANQKRFISAGEAFGGIKEIKLLGREYAFLNRYSNASYEFASSQASYQALSQIPKYLIEAIAFGGLIATAIVLLIIDGGLSKSGSLGQVLPILGIYAFSAYRLQPALQSVFFGLASIKYGKAAVDNFYEDLFCNNGLTENLSRETPFQLKLIKYIELNNICYIYPGAPKHALENLNIIIPVGNSIGIVGGTGAGKTTLVDLFLGLLQPTQGSIKLDGQNLNADILRSWQKSLGYVPQEIYLTDATIEENIAFGIDKSEINKKQLKKAAKMAQINNFIEQELPEKYQTVVGERGVRLSGGQRQRIGIARALYNDPDFLVLDEATSALDTITEQSMMESINAIARHKTIIIITHRLSTVKSCDQIMVLQNGRINEIGSYEELMRKSNEFREMVIIND
jgi:ATP-binding cassette, subfamily B, bacterial PglK